MIICITGIKHPFIALISFFSICVAIASSSKLFRQKLSDALVTFAAPLRIVDRTAPDEDFPELISYDDVARSHNADGGAGSALLVKGVAAVRAMRDFCCTYSKEGDNLVLRACTPFVGGVLRRAEVRFHSGANPLFRFRCVMMCVGLLSALCRC